MASKYAGLPDIDTSNPDVYETPDVPSSFSFGHDSDSDSDHEMSASGSSGNLLKAAARQASPSEEAIDRARLKPADARDLFAKRKLATTANGGRAAASLLPESSTYSIKNATRRHKLSETAKRQLRHQHMLDDDGNPLSDEPETSTEKLRRLRYEAQELEEQLEAEAAERARTKRAASTPSHEDEVEESEYESTDDLPRRDDADKTKPPPSRRRRKKPLADENGELSPAVLLRQLKRMRNGLEALSTSDAYSAGEGSVVEPSNEARSKELLRKLSKIGSHSASGEQHTYVAASHAAASNGSNSLSQLDRRLDLLEKYVGTNEADIDEARPLPPPLLVSLARLEHQLQLLTQPRHLDTISRRVKTLVTDLERVHEARRKIGDTRPLNIALSSGITVSTGQPGVLPFATDGSGQAASSGSTVLTEPQMPPDALQKIDSLFNILPRLEPLLPLAPHLLTRLKSLSTLHEASSNFSMDLKDGTKAIQGLKESESLMKQLLEGLQDSLDANQEVVKNNLEGLQNRIDQVLKRVEALSA